MKLHKRIGAGLMALSIFAACMPGGRVYAAAPAPGHDETMYVNLDHYGAIDETRIVKSYSVNGASEIVDFGNYSKVTNMSTLEKPQMKNGKLKFEAQEDMKRFYFEAVPAQQKPVLPWSFDVSYKLNGVETSAEELAGKSGLIDMTVKAIPNSSASEYYRNNMLLQVAAMVDMDEVLSIEAPGAQLQSVGSRKAAIFMGLPGEENEFVVRIGSDDFEFPGFGIMMIPATLSQLEEIKELKETKEKIEDSANAMNASMDVVLNTLESMQSGIKGTSEGLRELDAARETISTSKESLYDKADISIENLDQSARQVEKLIPHLEEAQTLADNVNKQLNIMVDTTKTIKPKLTKLQRVLEDLNDNLDSLSDMVDEMGQVKSSSSRRSRTLVMAVNNNIADYNQIATSIGEDISSLDAAGDLVGGGESGGGSGPVSDPKIDAILGGVSQMGSGLSDMGAMLGGLKSISGQYSSDIQSAMGNTKALNATVIEVSDIGKKMIDQIADLNKIIDENHPALVESLKDSKESMELATKSLDDAHSFVREAKDLMKKSGTQLDEGSKKSLNNLADVLDKSIKGLEQTGVIRNAKNTVKKLIDDEWEKYTETENHLLNIDTSAPMISFTSNQNRTPESIQIIMRTAEISKKSPDKAVKDLEAGALEDRGSFASRIADIFRKMADTVASAF